jgi:hypothetical protein
VWIGLVSYSWYLWHWPLLAFERTLRFGERDFALDSVAAVVALGFAAATFYLIERPIRRWRQSWGKPLGWRPVLAGVAICAAISIGGLTSFDAEGKRIAAAIGPGYLPKQAPKTEFCDLKSTPVEECVRMAAGRPIGLLIGDSHAWAGRNRIASLAETSGSFLASAFSGGCMTVAWTTVFMPDKAMSAECAQLRQNVQKSLSRDAIRPDYAILYARWPIYGDYKMDYQLGAADAVSPASDQKEAFVNALREALAELKSVGVKRILIIGPTPFFPRPVPNCLYLADRYGRDRARTCGVQRAAAYEETDAALARIKVAMAGMAEVRYLDAFNAFCDAERCVPYIADQVLFIDSNHLSDAGMDRIIASNEAEFDWVMGRDSGNKQWPR